MKKSFFAVIDGIDGIGKATQVSLLAERIRKEINPDVEVNDFPRYGKSFGGILVGEFLDGKFGSLKDVHPKLASLTYAIDRFQAKADMQKVLDRGGVVLCNRYVLASMAHQTAKLPQEEREDFLKFLDELEYGVFGIPREDFNILLYGSPELAQKQIDEKKDNREYLNGKKRDIAEEDLEHLSEAAKTYLYLSMIYPNRIKMIDCCGEDGNMLSREIVQEMVFAEVLKQLNEDREGQIKGERQR